MAAVPGMLCFFLIADDKVVCSEKNCSSQNPPLFSLELNMEGMGHFPCFDCMKLGFFLLCSKTQYLKMSENAC
jgi:hypothetical protein